MAITDIFSSKRSNNTVSEQSDQNKKEATSENNNRTMQDQAKDGLERVKGAVNNRLGNDHDGKDKNNNTNAEHHEKGIGEKVKEKVKSAVPDKSSEEEKKQEKSKESDDDNLEDQIQAGKDRAAEITDNLQEQFSSFSTSNADAEAKNRDHTDKKANQEEHNLLETLKTKAKDAHAMLTDQLDELKDRMQGNAAEAKEYSADAKTKLAKQQMEQAHDWMASAAKDKRDAMQMRTDQSADLVDRSESAEKGGMLQNATHKLKEGKDAVADRMTDNAITAKEGIASHKMELAKGLFSEAKAMTEEAKHDAVEAAKLRKEEKTEDDKSN